jgi:hypothetical protein
VPLTTGPRRSAGRSLRALAIQNGGRHPAAVGHLEAKWRSPRFLSRAAQADAGMKTIAAVPWLAETSVGLELLGLTEQQIDTGDGRASPPRWPRLPCVRSLRLPLPGR